ncbi:MAG: hypothetical protein DMF65_02605, partial [Acidobacteria bacterium]
MTTDTTRHAATGAHVVVREPLSPDEPTTIVEVFERALRRHARTDMLNYKRDGEWRSMSSEEFLRRVRRVALGLHAMGLRAGECAAILSES